MKYRKFKVENHPVLGNCDFDFTDNDKTVDTIILAGENGCGKTVLLNELYDFGQISSKGKNGINFVAEVELNNMELSLLNSNEAIRKRIINGIGNKIVKISQNFTLNNDNLWNQITVVIDNTPFPGHVLRKNDVSIFKCIYSDVEINFMPDTIKTVSSRNIDQISGSIKSTRNLATEISQLLIDIKSLDDSDLSEWVGNNPGRVPPDEIKSCRIKRFTNAFDSIFENKRFKRIRNAEGKKVIEFEEDGRVMSIEQLSSGEKQIVFRGGFLLKDKNNTIGSFVLVDEPEISLHPKWQMEILPFLKKLFVNEDGEQTSQIFIATHSPFIIHNSNRRNDKVIILQKKDGGIEVAITPEFYSWSDEKIVKAAFNVNLNFDRNMKYVFVEGETDEKYFNKAIDVYGIDKNKISVEWIGRRINNDIVNTGKNALDNAAKFIESTTVVTSPVYLLYDCDTHKPEEDGHVLHIRCMTNNAGNSQYKIGVENLLILPDEFDPEPYYETDSSTTGYGERKTIQRLKKMSLCDDICAKSNDELVDILLNIKKEIDKILGN